MRFFSGIGAGCLIALAVVASCADPQRPTLAITPIGGTVPAGQTLQLSATRQYPGARAEVVTTLLDWSSSNDAALHVSNDPGSKGLLTGALATSSVVYVTAHDPMSDASETVSFTVAPPEIKTILVSPSPAVVIARGQSRPLSAIATFTDGSTADVTGGVVWASSNLTAVTVSTSGKDRGNATGVAPGRADVTATDPRTLVQGTTSVFVTGPGDVRSITVAPNPATAQIGQNLLFIAVGYFADGTSQDLTQQVKWESSKPSVAFIAQGGAATGALAGETTITATDALGQVRGSALLTVTP
jgi:hypothetical protein